MNTLLDITIPTIFRLALLFTGFTMMGRAVMFKKSTKVQAFFMAIWTVYFIYSMIKFVLGHSIFTINRAFPYFVMDVINLGVEILVLFAGDVLGRWLRYEAAIAVLNNGKPRKMFPLKFVFDKAYEGKEKPEWFKKIEERRKDEQTRLIDIKEQIKKDWVLYEDMEFKFKKDPNGGYLILQK